MNQQEDKLQGEILEDAKAKAERLVAKARNDADEVIAKAKKDAQGKHQQRVKDAQDEADRQVKTILAGIQMEIHRRWLGHQEACIQNVLGEALEKAQAVTGQQRLEALRILAEEALLAIGNEACTVTISPDSQQDLTPQWFQELAQKLFGTQQVAEITVTTDDKLQGGLVIRTADGRKTFDNTFSRRLERMRDDLRLILVNGQN